MIKKLIENEKIPFHMPGHKRNVELSPFLKELRADLDITEIDGFDNLAHPQEILKEKMQKASKIWGSDKSYFLVGGSTCGILAGLATFLSDGETVLMCRASHKSFYNGLELLGLKSEFINGEIYNSSGNYSAINPQDIKNALENNKNIKLVAITSPTYEGKIQPIKEIAKICHEYNVPLMVDEAHGSHLGFSNYFYGGAVKNGADYVVQSLHKTLLGLTQTGICHANGNLINTIKLEHYLTVFQTSSPSYLLLASICSCVDFLCEDKNKAFENWANMLDKFYLRVKDLKNIKINTEENRDKSKILIDCSNANINGKEIMSILREKFNIELEMAYSDCALAMTGLGELEKNLDLLAFALLEIDKTLIFEKKEVTSLNDFEKTPKMSIKNALNLKNIKVDEKDAIGKISATHIWVYPPGIPVVIAGEEIKLSTIKLIDSLKNNGAEILDTHNAYPQYIVLD